MNAIILIGTFNVASSLFVLPWVGITEFQIEMLVMSLIGPILLYFNHRFNYQIAAFGFYGSGAVFMYFLTTKMGLESFVILFYFPLMLSVIFLFGRAETFKLMWALLAVFFAVILASGISIYNDFLTIDWPNKAGLDIKLLNIILSFSTSVLFMVIVTKENINRERLLKKTLKDKEVLLAEVYHRVKNNMNIVTSLINLKKNSSDSEEVISALESCRSRVYSMSLVHEKLIAQNSFAAISFDQYVHQLTNAVADMFGGKPAVEIVLHSEELQLELSQAIPCGLILNELITNSFKHAKPANGKLKIVIQLKADQDMIEILVRDNGAGFNPLDGENSGSMGLELVNSLCEQLDATLTFIKDSGASYLITFQKKPEKKLS